MKRRRGRGAYWCAGLVALGALGCQGAGDEEVSRSVAAVSTAPFRESGGLVVMEAENATGTAPGTGPAAPRGCGRAGEPTVGPRQDYHVHFGTAGTYRLWVRGRGASPGGDTVHAGLDGTPVNPDTGLLFPRHWAWIDRAGARRLTITVPGPGLHTINLWIREDRVLVDKLLLTTSAAFVPSGLGPAESPRDEAPPAAVVLPPGHRLCDGACQAQAPAQVTACPSTNPGCTSARSTTVAWTLEGQPFTPLVLLLEGSELVPRIDGGNGRAIAGGLVQLDGARPEVRCDETLTLTHYGVAPAWGGTTPLAFRLLTLPGDPMTTHFYWYSGQPMGDVAQQIHQEVVSIVADEVAVAGLSPGKQGGAFFVPTELASGEGNFSFSDGSVSINYGNPPYWTSFPGGILGIITQEFAHEYGHQIFDAISPAHGGNVSCLNEGLANAIAFVVGRIPASKMGPFGLRGENFDGDCTLASEIHDVGNCYFHHVRKAGLLTASFARSLYHPQHAYSFDSCAPGTLSTGDALVVMFTEASGQDQTALVSGMGIPTSGSYAASRAELGF